MGDIWVDVRGKDGSFGAYLAGPKSGKGPGVVVIQEIFGINKFVRNVADWLADQGYLALAPDLFWRIKPNIELDPTVPAQFQTGLDYYGKFNPPDGVSDIQATITTLRKLPGCRLARMSGSGATCFALFDSEDARGDVHAGISLGHPHWWCLESTLA